MLSSDYAASSNNSSICHQVGIVGRTGAGKSSLFNALLRLEEFSGEVRINDVDIMQVGLADLRSMTTLLLQVSIGRGRMG